jgi:hypothetical protein
MIKVIEEILSKSGGDGDFIRGGIRETPDRSEIHEILKAWSQDLGRGIECLLLLGRVRRLLCRILASGRLTDRIEREMKGLLRLIDSIDKDAPASQG